MAGEVWGRAKWPGVQQVRYAKYTFSQGISPESAVLRVIPQPGKPFAQKGTLVIMDGFRAVAIPGCKVDRLREVRNSAGTEWELTIIDHRWRWRDCGHVSLWVNQLDPHSKLIPWTVRSPEEIARYCLRAMGEPNFKIDLPAGLTNAQAIAMSGGGKDFLPTGLNLPSTFTNPPIDWQYVRPAQVLQELAERYGRRVVWRWGLGEVWITKIGEGGSLPAGSISSRSPSFDDPETPDGCMVAGAPNRYQVDLDLQAAGEEWDGTPKPIDSLSYAPKLPGQKHTITLTGTYQAGWTYYADVVFDLNKDPVRLVGGPTAGSMAATAAQIKASFDAAAANNPDLKAAITCTVAGDVVTFTATKDGPAFTIGTDLQWVGQAQPQPDMRAAWTTTLVRQGQIGKNGWDRSWPPLFPGVRATDRLTLGQARELARKTVWRWYILSGLDTSGKGPINVPGYGKLKRRQQLVMLDTQCEQVVPAPADLEVRMKDGTPFVQTLYNGYSRDKPAAVYGPVFTRLAGHLFFMANRRGGVNTKPNEQVQVDFTIDNVWQLVKFSGPVYNVGAGYTIKDPGLTLRTAVHVRDPETNALVCYEKAQLFAGREGNVYAVERHEDVQLNVIPTYKPTPHVPIRVQLLEQDPLNRADYYIAGMLARYQPKASLVNEYNGIMNINLDGAISQLTWEVGEGVGAKTTASLNFEHATSFPPFPGRRRNENLRSAAEPGGFMGMGNGRTDPTKITPFAAPGGGR